MFFDTTIHEHQNPWKLQSTHFPIFPSTNGHNGTWPRHLSSSISKDAKSPNSMALVMTNEQHMWFNLFDECGETKIWEKQY